MRNKLNAPVIIKFLFWEYTKKNPHAFYACVNLGEVGCSRDIVKRSVRIIRIQRLNRPEPGCLQIGRKKHMDKHDLIKQLHFLIKCLETEMPEYAECALPDDPRQAFDL